MQFSYGILYQLKRSSIDFFTAEFIHIANIKKEDFSGHFH